jgi:hypothetical protein
MVGSKAHSASPHAMHASFVIENTARELAARWELGLQLSAVAETALRGFWAHRVLNRRSWTNGLSPQAQKTVSDDLCAAEKNKPRLVSGVWHVGESQGRRHGRGTDTSRSAACRACASCRLNFGSRPRLCPGRKNGARGGAIHQIRRALSSVLLPPSRPESDQNQHSSA